LSARCVVPRLTGLTVRRAKAVLARAGCRLGRVTRRYSPRVEKGRVSAQRPRRGLRLARGARVNVTVSLGIRPPP
jgi:eukaryotic-like serine/threonine-protein kinase